MISYFLMYLTPAFITLTARLTKQKFLWYLMFLIFVLIIGFRHEVGGDWENYLHHLDLMTYKTLEEVLLDSDPGYYILVYWIRDIYWINFISATIFMTGLLFFVQKQDNAWLAFSVAIPYLLIIVAMGYTRQSVAIGFIMMGLYFLDQGKLKYYLFFIVLASLFHKSAVLMIGIGLFASNVNIFIRILAIFIVGFGIYESFLVQYQEHLWHSYVDAQMESQGAKIRVLMNIVPSLLLFTFRKEWKYYFHDYALWKIVALLSIASFFLVNYASTAVDRMALYFIVIQLVVFGRLPKLAQHKIKPKYTIILILLYYFLVLFVWMMFASHAYTWLPYQNILVYDLF